MHQIWALLRDNSMLQFFLIGGLLFLIFPPSEEESAVHISKRKIEAYRAAKAKSLKVKQLTPVQVAEVDRRLLWDELLYRYALSQGLSQNDHIIRQRLIQKVIFLHEYLAGIQKPPSKKELMRTYQRYPKRWRAEGTVQFFHIFFAKKDVKRIQEVRQQILSKKASPTSRGTKPPALGDHFVLSQDISGWSEERIGRDFGKHFAKAIKKLSLGRWSGVIPSKFGWHLVKVVSRTKAGRKPFAQVQEDLKEAWIIDKKKQVLHELLQKLYKQYQPRLHGYKADAFLPKVP